MTDQRPGYIGYCDTHRKRLYPSRKQAKRELRRHAHPKGMREYPCTEVDGHWHLGHLPLDVVQGRKTAGEIYRGQS